MTTKKPAKKKAKRKKKVTRKSQSASKVMREQAQKQLGGNNFWPWPLRHYQQDAENARQRGIKRLGLFWHRRAGKDVYCLSIARNESRKRIGGYVHFFPKHVQAKRALWNGIDPKKGARFIDTAFGDQIAEVNNTEMFIEMYNGATWQLLGSDNYDRIVGSNAVGVFFSEWALCDPRAWDFIRPIILENDGFAVFITTFRGRNHAWQMAQNLANNPDWYIDIRPANETHDLEGKPILSEAMIQAERDSGMSEALIQQEYYCNPEAVAEGAIYGRQVEQLRRDTSRHAALWNPNKPVFCVWNTDLPVHASYILIQPGTTPVILSAETLQFTTLNEVLTKAEQQRFPIQTHLLPGSQRDLVPAFNDLCRMPQVLARENPLQTNTSTSNLIEKCMISKPHCEELLDALSGYVRRERFDSQVADMQYTDYPVDSWHSHLVKALETWASWEYYSGSGEWQSKPDYRTQDRIAKTLI